MVRAAVTDEVVAESLTICGLDFSEFNLPRVRAEARFVMPAADTIDSALLEAWQETHAWLDTGVVFRWDFPGADAGLDCSELVNHQGLGMILRSPDIASGRKTT